MKNLETTSRIRRHKFELGHTDISATGGMGTVASVVCKRLAAMIATKYAKSYSLTMQWIRCRDQV